MQFFILVSVQFLLCSAEWYDSIFQKIPEYSNVQPMRTIKPFPFQASYYRYFNVLISVRCDDRDPHSIYNVRAFQLLRLNNGTIVERQIGKTEANMKSDIEFTARVLTLINPIIFEEVPSNVYVEYAKVCECDHLFEYIPETVQIPIEYLFANRTLADKNQFTIKSNSCF